MSDGDWKQRVDESSAYRAAALVVTLLGLATLVVGLATTGGDRRPVSILGYVLLAAIAVTFAIALAAARPKKKHGR